MSNAVHKHLSFATVVVGIWAIACGTTPTADDIGIYGEGQGQGQSGTAIFSIPSGNSGSYAIAGTGSGVAGAGVVVAGGSGAKVGIGGRAAVGGGGAKVGNGGRAAAGGSGGKTGAGGLATGGSGAKAGTGAAGKGSGGSGASTTKFSFFITSLDAMVKLSGSDKGFGGDLRYGEATGLAGADKICTEIAEAALPGSGSKGWHAFLSTTTKNAKERIGAGPWYDRKERLIALSLTDLLNTRPVGADPAISSDLPDENGIPMKSLGDNHDILTGTNASGVYDGRGLGNTCNDWTTTVASTGKPTIGHSWPRSGGGGGGGGSASSWINAHTAPGCGAGVNLANDGAGSGTCVGCAGGYGAIYCFAMTP